MAVFNLTDQNSNLNNKIVAGLERISQVFRILLWEKAKLYNLSPIQIQLLIFIEYHSSEKTTVSYLAREFNFTKPTISDAIRVLEQKELIIKITDSYDTRSYSIQLSETGKKVVSGTEDFTNPVLEIIEMTSGIEKIILWRNISNLIIALNKKQVISVQRTCVNCKHYSFDGSDHFCNLLKITLQDDGIRIDCGEFERA